MKIFGGIPLLLYMLIITNLYIPCSSFNVKNIFGNQISSNNKNKLLEGIITFASHSLLNNENKVIHGYKKNKLLEGIITFGSHNFPKLFFNNILNFIKKLLCSYTINNCVFIKISLKIVEDTIDSINNISQDTIDSNSQDTIDSINNISQDTIDSINNISQDTIDSINNISQDTIDSNSQDTSESNVENQINGKIRKDELEQSLIYTIHEKIRKHKLNKILNDIKNYVKTNCESENPIGKEKLDLILNNIINYVANQLQKVELDDFDILIEIINYVEKNFCKPSENQLQKVNINEISDDIIEFVETFLHSTCGN